MNSHPSYAAISAFITTYPHLSGCLFQVYNDLLHAQRWKNIDILELPDCRRVALSGEGPDTLSSFVVPCYLSEPLTLDWLATIFEELGGVPEIHLAIVSDDASIVYYRIGQGIVKPVL